MTQKTIERDGQRWAVTNTGRHTQYGKDEFSLCFSRVGAEPPEQRVARYSPQGAKNRENSLAELSDRALIDLLNRSQPSWTTPELEYRR
jgi:hypothetical protein